MLIFRGSIVKFQEILIKNFSSIMLMKKFWSKIFDQKKVFWSPSKVGHPTLVFSSTLKNFDQEIFFYVNAAIPPFLAMKNTNPVGKNFFELLKKYFIIKKWFFRLKKVKISRFYFENHSKNHQNRVFRCWFTLGKCPFLIF